MFESIISPETAEKNPWDMFIVGIIVSSFAILFGAVIADYLQINPSVLVLTIIVVAMAPLMHRVLSIEEGRDEQEASQRFSINVIGRHIDVLLLYTFLFLGILFSFIFWFTVLPDTPDTSNPFSVQNIFGEQITILMGINPVVVSEDLHKPSGEVVSGMVGASDGASEDSVDNPGKKCFTKLFRNNMLVMLFSFTASFLFGAGALWILSWNASILATLTGFIIKKSINSSSPVAAYMSGFSDLLQRALWGIPEIGAYFIAGLSGGIVSAAVVKHHYASSKFWFAVADALILLFVTFILIYLGALIEAPFVPVKFCLVS